MKYKRILYTRSKKVIDRKDTYNKKKRLSGAAARTGNFSKIRCRKYNKREKRLSSNK